jgi:hypothetical protein
VAVIFGHHLLTPAASTTAADGSHDVLGLDIGAGRSGSNPTSAIVLSQRAARHRQRDDPIALPLESSHRSEWAGAMERLRAVELRGGRNEVAKLDA